MFPAHCTGGQKRDFHGSSLPELRLRYLRKRDEGHTMPKASSSTLNCLFAVIKPSGPASMTVVNTVKPLLSASRLFFRPEDGESHKTAKTKAKRKRRGKGGLNHLIKMGTGGTLDPLADGVLGTCGLNQCTRKLTCHIHGYSSWAGRWDETVVRVS